jgi:hypothetical protein
MMKIGGVYWYLGTFPFRFEFWDENQVSGAVSKLLVRLKLSPEPVPSSELRGVELDIGRLMEDGDTIGDCRPHRFTEAELYDNPKKLGLNSDDLRHLKMYIERGCRGLKVDDPDDWRIKLARHLGDMESDLLFEEVCAANPGRSVCIDGCGISIG